MITLPSLKKLLWIDATAALLSGSIVLSLNSYMARWLGLPEDLLTILSLVSLGYGLFSTYLARQKDYNLPLIKVLIGANLTYASVIIGLAVFFCGRANVFGVVYLVLESLFVAVLALSEWRKVEEFEKANNQDYDS